VAQLRANIDFIWIARAAFQLCQHMPASTGGATSHYFL